jgi:hypothetical protein
MGMTEEQIFVAAGEYMQAESRKRQGGEHE